MAEWRERRYGGKNDRIAEWQKWLHTYYGIGEWRNGNRMAEWQNGGMAVLQNGRIAECGMAEWRNGNRMGGNGSKRKEWQNSRMAEMATYVLWNRGMAEW